MKILIADDEPLARQRLKRILNEIDSDFTVLSNAGNGLEALTQCLIEKPDLALLDIRMPTMDGLQTATEIMKANLNTAVVFVTAYDEYAVAAFDNNAIDYLLKPVKKQRLEIMLEKAKQFSLSQEKITKAELATTPREHLCAHSHLGVEIIKLTDVLYFKADNKYVSAVTSSKSTLLDESLKALEIEFAELFFRIHRNSLINISTIKLINKNSSGQHQVIIDGIDEPIIVSRRHQAELKKRLRS
ncbi:MAG: DNA-binding response regulator [Piscirickettsiaceae bacterium]|nr:MAG: DNA-binding response regulator [Piscirickettsiaceae bacterium]